jgi:hypothetical protein
MQQRKGESAMNAHGAILEVEKGFWSGGADFYRANVDEKCLVAFSEMAGVMSNDKVASTVADGARWKDLKMDEKGFLQLDDDTAILTYRAEASRPNGDVYRALVSSGYVKHNGAWKLMFHQQTPLMYEAAA